MPTPGSSVISKRRWSHPRSDETTDAFNAEDMFGREAKLPDLVKTQSTHADLAKAITDALAAQADAAVEELRAAYAAHVETQEA